MFSSACAHPQLPGPRAVSTRSPRVITVSIQHLPTRSNRIDFHQALIRMCATPRDRRQDEEEEQRHVITPLPAGPPPPLRRSPAPDPALALKILRWRLDTAEEAQEAEEVRVAIQCIESNEYPPAFPITRVDSMVRRIAVERIQYESSFLVPFSVSRAHEGPRAF